MSLRVIKHTLKTTVEVRVSYDTPVVESIIDTFVDKVKGLYVVEDNAVEMIRASEFKDQERFRRAVFRVEMPVDASISSVQADLRDILRRCKNGKSD